MNKRLRILLLVALIVLPTGTFAYDAGLGCTHGITDLATGSGSWGGPECTTERLLQLGNDPTLKTVERIDALRAVMWILQDKLKQLQAGANKSCLDLTHDLWMGRTDAETSGEVSKLQLWLKAEGYFPDAQGTGYYGEQTAQAVVKWQKAHGMDFVTAKSGVGPMTRAKLKEACGKPTAMQCAKYNDSPVITSLLPSSGPTGTKITVNGCNFLGFESDKNFWIKNTAGTKAILYAERDGSNAVARLTLPASACQQDTSYSGLDCPATLDLIPGTYSIQASSWGGLSNAVNFTVTAQ